jgi:hypothetical protein
MGLMFVRGNMLSYGRRSLQVDAINRANGHAYISLLTEQASSLLRLGFSCLV